MSFELFVALRYLKSKRRTGFVSAVTYISVAGVIIGVAALVIILSVMNGYENEVRARLIGIDGHVKVRTFYSKGFDHYESVLAQIGIMPHVQAMTTYIDNKGLIISEKNSTAIQIKGIDPMTVEEIIPLSELIVDGELCLDQLETDTKSTIYGIVLGDDLAEKLQVDLGDEVVIASLAGITHYRQMPNKMRFSVTGRFKTGLFEFDNSSAFVSISAAQILFNMREKITGIELRLDDLKNADKVSRMLTDQLGYPYRALTWADLNANLFAWYRIQKWAGFIVLSLIIMVAAFNIASTLIMVSMEKTREIGILKSMGATSANIRRIFTLEGLFVGISGTLLGFLCGFILCWLQQSYRFLSLPADVYIIGWLPILMKWNDFVLIAVVVTCITFIAAVYPASRAAKLDPVAAIRLE